MANIHKYVLTPGYVGKGMAVSEMQVRPICHWLSKPCNGRRNYEDIDILIPGGDVDRRLFFLVLNNSEELSGSTWRWGSSVNDRGVRL